jgi:hypothetical protein
LAEAYINGARRYMRGPSVAGRTRSSLRHYQNSARPEAFDLRPLTMLARRPRNGPTSDDPARPVSAVRDFNAVVTGGNATPSPINGQRVALGAGASSTGQRRYCITGPDDTYSDGFGDSVVGRNVRHRLVFGMASAQDPGLPSGRSGTEAELPGKHKGDALHITEHKTLGQQCYPSVHRQSRARNSHYYQERTAGQNVAAVSPCRCSQMRHSMERLFLAHIYSKG